MKIDFLKKLFDRTKKDNANKIMFIFPKDDFKEISILKKYPSVTLLIEDNVYAYRMLFCVDNESAEIILQLINDHFKSNITIEGANDIVISSGNQAISFNMYNDFEGKVVRLITNSDAFFSKIWELKIMPPPPWISFPEIDPDGLGSMQGNLSFWWDWMWLPFWDSLDSAQKEDYLIANAAPLGWVEYFNFYEVHIRKNK